LEDAVPRYNHELGDVAALLDAKIAALREVKTEVTGRIKAGINPIENSEALRQISASLAHARDARAAVDESCCGQSCPIDYF
jgi:chromatin segregation and condensation protein Rec8/ScpA/Scc1 (kleisin family)